MLLDRFPLRLLLFRLLFKLLPKLLLKLLFNLFKRLFPVLTVLSIKSFAESEIEFTAVFNDLLNWFVAFVTVGISGISTFGRDGTGTVPPVKKEIMEKIKRFDSDGKVTILDEFGHVIN